MNVFFIRDEKGLKTIKSESFWLVNQEEDVIQSELPG